MKNRIIALALGSLLIGSGVDAQTWDTRVDPNEMVLVTPEGDLLPYTPDAADIIVRRNARGHRVLIDHYGNVVATEMPGRVYDRQYGASRQRRLPGVETFDNRESVATNENEPGYFPEKPGLGDVTGTIERQDLGDLEEQPLPSDGIQNDNLGDGDLASLDPTMPQVDDRLPDPVIQLNGKKSKFEITALQVFLDRAGASPGVIDGQMGLNVSKALHSYEKISGEKLDPNNIEDILSRLAYTGGLPVMDYTITAADAAGPYVAAIPEDYSQKAALPSMAYTSVTEALSERFHMDEAYLKALNPGKDFTIPGTIVKVVNPGIPKSGSVSSIVADKFRKQVFAYDASGALIVSYPASIGSTDTPSPSGIHTVERVALDPNYTYNPKINFQQGSNTKVLTIPPGPNGPVGTVWLALDKPTYGIHGTPDPSRIGRSQSHGCIRLTNWDARELAKMVKPGVTVEFID